jgi:hypothetical protein
MKRQASHLAWAGVALPTLVLAAPYVDKVLDEGPQPALKIERQIDTEGWARGWRVEATTARDRANGVSSTSSGIAFNGYVETPHHGTLTMTASLSRASVALATAQESRTATLWRIDQVAMPLDGGWLANHSAGHVTSVQAPMARGFGNLGLPTIPIEGVTGQYVHGNRTNYAFAAGRPGLYTGWGTTGFDSGTGRVLFASGQQALGGALAGSTLALQWNDARGVARNGNIGPRFDTTGWWAGWLWEGRAPWATSLAPGSLPAYRRHGGFELQANVLHTRTDDPSRPDSGDRSGTWIDARWRSESLEQAGGLFYLQPNLRWGTYDVVSDLRGAYWRGDYSTRRWFLSASTEWAESLTGRSFGGSYLNLAGTYRLDTRTGLAGAMSIRRGDASGESMQLAVERTSEWGQTRWQFDALHTDNRRARRFGVDHNFAVTTDGNLALSLAAERDNTRGVRNNALLWGVVGSVQPWTGIALDANLRGTHGSFQRVVNGGVGATWTINPNWSLVGQWTHTRGQDTTALAVLSPVNQAAELIAIQPFSVNRVQFTLRYQDSAGSSQVPIGGAAGTGSGTVSGYVFYDNNDNGRREAAERGVPDVIVRLNGRFIARTDSQGRYEFALVAAGVHRIEVVSDNLPLPWNLAIPGTQQVDVRVRRVTNRDFAIRRDVTGTDDNSPTAMN